MALHITAIQIYIYIRSAYKNKLLLLVYHALNYKKKEMEPLIKAEVKMALSTVKIHKIHFRFTIIIMPNRNKAHMSYNSILFAI